MGSILGSVGTDISEAMDFFAALLNPHTWVRVFFVIVGAALILMSFKVGGLA